jgi:hypothetical protein
LRRLQIGETVIGPRGRLGTLDRLVVDEHAHAITHLVVDGHVVGAGHFRFTHDDVLQCDLTPDALAAMPDVRHADVAGAPAHWEAPAGYALADFLRIAGALIGQGPYVPPVRIEPDLKRVHQLTEGSPVWYRDRQLGEVALLLTGESGEVDELVVQPPALGEPRLMSPDHVVEVVGNNVHVDVAPDAFHSLPRYVEDSDPAAT